MGLSQPDIDALLAPEAEGSAPSAVVAPPPPSVPAAAPSPPDPLASAPSAAPPKDGEIERIRRLPVPVIVKLAERYVPIRSIVTWTVGSIIEFETPADSELELMVVNQSIGTGKAVKVGENFGLRISRLQSVQERIQAMGGGQNEEQRMANSE